MGKIKRQEQKLTDLRDERDKLKDRDPVTDEVQQSLDDMLEVIKRQIDRTKVKIRKLKKENRQRSKDSKPHVVLTRISPNQSVRSTQISGIVVHCTVSNNVEGSDSDIAGVANWFANPASQVSAHVITDSDGHSGVTVETEKKAWHCAAYNSPTFGIENIGQVTDNWTDKQYDECARWVALISYQKGLPLQRGSVANGGFIKKGVVTHAELGSLGGSHSDPGPKFDMQKMMAKAQKYYNALKGGK